MQGGGAPGEVMQQALAALVTLIRRLGQELEDDGGQGLGNVRLHCVRCRRQVTDVVVDPLQGGIRAERGAAGQQFKQQYAQRVVIRAIVEAAVHAPGLFRGDVGQQPFQVARQVGGLVFLPQLGGDAEAGQGQRLAPAVDEHVVGREGFMDDVPGVNVAQDGRQVPGNGQHLRDRQALVRGVVQPGGQGSVEQVRDQREVAAAMGKRLVDAADPVHTLEAVGDPGFMVERGHLPAVGVVRVQGLNGDLGAIGKALAAECDPPCVPPQTGKDGVAGELDGALHQGLPSRLKPGTNGQWWR